MGLKFNPFTGNFDIVDSPSGDFSDVQLDQGTATAPSISFDGDPNTGIYSPGADQVAVATSGEGRLFVDASGNIGINTAAGSASGFGAFFKIKTASASPGFFLENSAVDSWWGIYGGTGPTDSAALIYPSTGSLRIATSTSVGVDGFSEKIRITSAGLVGIGTSSPVAKLQVAIGANDYTDQANTFGVRGPNSTGLYVGTHFDGSGGGADLVSRGYVTEMGDFRFIAVNGSYASPTTRMVIDPSGRVGIGTTSPSNTLEISKEANHGITLARPAEGVNPGNFKLEVSSNGAGVITADNNLSLETGSSQQFIVSRGATESFRVDSNSRLLVGTSSARTVGTVGTAAMLSQIESTGGDAGFSIIRNSNGATAGSIVLAKSRGTANGSSTVVQDDDDLGYIHFNGADGSDVISVAARISAHVDGTPGANDMPGRLVFSTTADGASSPTERMRITSGGEVWFNTTTGTIDSSNHGAKIQNNGVVRLSGNTNASQVTLQVFGTLGEFKVLGDGDCENTNNSYGAISDIKLKENIVDANSQWSDIKALQVRNYNLKPEIGYSTHTQIGLVAQEVELVSPGLVSESPDRDEEGNDLGTVTKSVNYSVLYMKAVKALQEAMERIETLEAKVAALEAN